ncbi:VanW family protein [Cohnella lupini]|uniref:Vancomycin resistance protein VanW n=1 Tax=Cohnella lupini TaxID=1294267 RepID=A0A3D9HYX1_9BACL|nr:VanW family protein [Cohnella lupini]RED54702.1 vancomycin resistance protein VanW [Cohnella lupini]
MKPELRPIPRSSLRLRVGKWAYTSRRYMEWMFGGVKFARRKSSTLLPHAMAQHRTPLFRRLAKTDMWMQSNKVVNLSLAVPRLHGILLRPGETFSYWRLIGNPTRSKGYVDGMVLFCGEVRSGVAGGLCQLSNLIYWITLHTELTVTERHRHSYDVFPDANRTQPFGSGATCSYNYRDLRIMNNTSVNYQLFLSIDGDFLQGRWLAEQPSFYRYEVKEKDHAITSEPWGGYVRHNRLYRDVFALDGEWLREEDITENHALMMYSPLLGETSKEH